MLNKMKKMIAGLLAAVMITTNVCPMVSVSAASGVASLESLGKLGTVNIGSKSESGTWLQTQVDSKPVFCMDLGKACHTGYTYKSESKTISSDDANTKNKLEAKIGYWYDQVKKGSNKAWVYAQCLIWSVEEGYTSESNLKSVINQVKKNTGYYKDDMLYSDIFEVGKKVECDIYIWKYSGSTDDSEVQKLLQIKSTDEEYKYLATSGKRYYRQRITLEKVDEIGAEDSVLNISAFDFDLSVFDIFGLLTVGGTIVLIDEDDFRDPEVWKNLIEIYGITIWNSAPALLDMFLIMGENNHFGKLRLALVSGDWIPLYLPEKWYKVTSANSQFVALGGATEGGIWSNYYCVSKVDRLWNSIPYGQALPKQKYRITDENFVECGVDIPGELQIGGGSLAKGYINDEELTMKKFITDVKGERWYRTGDRGRRWADGTIEFLGRMDTQVKIRGHRIELGEIESVLKSISRIKEAVVVAQGDKYHKELVAFYLGEYIAESEIEDYLKIHLPEYSIPNSINRLENFPLNANGKVDRRRLAEYQKTDSVEIMSDKVLNIVLMIWEELLKNKVADLDENLFKIGADSLLAARFVAAINARCGIEVRMKEVFMNPSINALTKLVDKRKNTDIAEFVEEGEI